MHCTLQLSQRRYRRQLMPEAKESSQPSIMKKESTKIITEAFLISETVFKYKTDVFLFYKLGSDTLLRRPASQYALHTCQMMNLLVKIIQSDKLIININNQPRLGNMYRETRQPRAHTNLSPRYHLSFPRNRSVC